MVTIEKQTRNSVAGGYQIDHGQSAQSMSKVHKFRKKEDEDLRERCLSFLIEQLKAEDYWDLTYLLKAMNECDFITNFVSLIQASKNGSWVLPDELVSRSSICSRDIEQQELTARPDLSHDMNPEMYFEACSKLEDLKLEARKTSLHKVKENLDGDSFRRQDDIHVCIHEVIFSAVDKESTRIGMLFHSILLWNWAGNDE
ncbi:unnamed protein product [Lactuca saligna]|uniref:Uncharacterized protein n=1 Tax=Lactuca saligna TaxID=75948 RepID=A0AA35VHW0_LACSI|nr:unnamed protein product [Lactuca saligna]